MNDETPIIQGPDEALWQFAQRIAPAKVLPEHLRNDPASVYFILEMGKDWGMPRTQSITATFQRKEGTLGMYGAAMLSLLYQRGFKVDFAYAEAPVGCYCTITRPDNGLVFTRSFDMVEAGAIETFWDPEQKRFHRLADDPFYRNYPRECCQWRSLARCGRVAAPDIANGMYTPEELVGGAMDSKPTPASGPAPQETAAPAADEFVVGEKPEPEPREESLASFGPEVAAGTLPAAEAVAIVDAPTSHFSPSIEGAKQAVGSASPNVVEMPAPAPAAETQQAPAAPQPPPVEATFDTMIALVDAKVGGDTAAVHKLVARYFKTFLDVRSVPKDRAKLTPPLAALVAVLDQHLGDLKADPEGLGLLLSGRAKSALVQEYEAMGWDSPLRELAKKVMDMLPMSEPQFLAWIAADIPGNNLPIGMMAPEAASIFLTLYLIVKTRAFEPVDFAVARKAPVLVTLQEIVKASGREIGAWDEPFAIAILDKLAEMGKELEAAPAPAPAPAQSLEDDVAFGGGLPFE